MKRALVLCTIFAAGLILAAGGFADPNEGKEKGKDKGKTSTGRTTGDEGHGKKGGKAGMGGTFRYNVVTADHGCAYQVWATDRVMRTYKVKRNENGTYTVRREDRGTFTTVASASPGSCPTTRGKHGTLIRAGVVGKLHGYLTGTVTGGAFNPNATCTAECTYGQFVTAFFGPGAQATCVNGYAGCRFSFEYTAQRENQQGLLYHHWVDRETDGVNEIFIGDIATA